MLSGKVQKNVSIVGHASEDSDDPLAQVPVERDVDREVGDVGQRVDRDAFVHRSDEAAKDSNFKAILIRFSPVWIYLRLTS